jgi:DNA polymerase-3 subunit delta
MPRQSYDDLQRALARGELAPVYYLYGSEDILKDESARAIVDRALEPHERDFNLDLREAKSLQPEELHSLVNTLPMMAARRCVVIREIEAWNRKTSMREGLLRYLGNPAQDTVLVLVETAPKEEKRDYKPDDELINRSYAVDFKELSPERVPKWLAHHAKKLGITFGRGAAEHLARAVQNDLGVLRAELDKFASVADEGPISLERAGELIGIYHGETLEHWVEAILADDAVAALNLTPRLLEQSGMGGVKMNNALGPGLLGLRLARSMYDRGTRGNALERALFDRFRQARLYGFGDWKASAANWSRWCENWSGTRLRAALRAAMENDTQLKNTTLSSEEGLMTALVLRLASSRRLGGSAARPALAGSQLR